MPVSILSKSKDQERERERERERGEKERERKSTLDSGRQIMTPERKDGVDVKVGG